MKIYLIISLILINLNFHSQNPVCGFAYKKTITIDGDQVSGTVTDFPILISHTDADLSTASAKVTSANGFDIIFSDDNGNPLDFQIEDYDGTTGTYTAWVKIPTLSNGTDIDIHMLYGKTSIATDQSTTNTWDSDFTGVWHMNQDPSGAAPQITEASGGGDNGTANGTMTTGDLVAGKNGNGIDFDGVDDFINIGDVLIDGTSSITFEAWVNPTLVPINATPSGHNSNEGAIVHKNGTTDDSFGITVSSGGTAFYIDEGSDNTAIGSVTATAVWTHIVGTWDNSTMTLYKNGVLDVTLGSVNGSFINNNNQLRFGGQHGAGGGNPHYFSGIIDEVRLSSTARSADWIATEYNSQNQPTTAVGVVTVGDFYTVGSERDLTFVSLSNGDWDVNTRWNQGFEPTRQFDNISSTHHLDIDNGSADYTICNCEFNGNGSRTVALDVEDGRVVTIKGDLTAITSGSGGTSITRIRTENDGTALVVEGNVNIENNLTTNGRIGFRVEDESNITIEGTTTMSSNGGDDLFITQTENSNLTFKDAVMVTNAGRDEIRFLQSGDAVLVFESTLSVSVTGGDDFRLEGNDNTSMDFRDDVTINISGGDDMLWEFDGDCDITFEDLIFNISGGDDHDVIMNLNAGTNASMIVNGTTTINKTGCDDIIFGTQGATSIMNLGDVTANCPSAADTEVLRFDANDGDIIMGTVNLSRSLDMGEIDFDLDGGDITIGALTLNSSGTLNGNQLISIDIDESSIFSCASDLIANISGGDDFRIGMNRNNGTTAQFLVGGDLTTNLSGGDDINWYIYQSSVFQVTGNIIINHSGGEENLIDIRDNGTLRSLDFTINQSGGQLMNFNINNLSTIDVLGDFNFTYSNGTGASSIEFLSGNTSVFNVAGNFNYNLEGGTQNIFLEMDGGTINVGGDITLNNVVDAFAADLEWIQDDNSNVNVTGDFIVNLSLGDDIDIDMGQNTAGSTSSLDITGDLILNQNNPNPGSIIGFLMNENCTVSANNIIFNHSAGDKLLMDINDNCILTANGDIDFNTGGAGLVELRGDNMSRIRIAGNFDRTPAAYGELDMALTSTLEFFGSTNTQIFPEDAGNGGDFFDFGLVEINNSFGSNPQITMEGLATVHNGIIWTDGVVASTAVNLLVIDDNATSTLATNASHCDGPIKKIGDDVFTFPTGDNDYYGGIEINSLTAQNTTDEFTAQYFEATHPETYFSRLGYEAAGGFTDAMEQTSRIEYWELSRDNGSCEPIVRLYWTNNIRSQISDINSLVVAHNTAVQTWKNEGGNNSGTLVSGYVESNAVVTSFSPFTFGSTDDSNNDLPVELLEFTANTVNNKTVDLNWKTASEINNDYFEIENTKDLVNWTSVDQISGAGNSNSLLEYGTIDYAPYTGDSYYRLKQVDFDGTTTYSDIKKVTINSDIDISVYPNPSSGIFNLVASDNSDELDWIIYDGNGRIVKQDKSNQNNSEIDLSNLANGIYTIQVSNGNEISTKKLTLLR